MAPMGVLPLDGSARMIFYFILMVTLLKVFKSNVIGSVLVSEVTGFQEPLSKTCFMTLLFIILKLDGKPLNAGKAGCNLY